MSRRVTRTILSSSLLLTTILICAPARAMVTLEEAMPAPRPLTVKLSLDFPMCKYSAVLDGDGGLANVAGGSLTFEIQERLLVEVGGNAQMASFAGISFGIFARAGGVFNLWQSAGDGPLAAGRAGRWQLQLPLLAGYLFQHRVEGGDGHSGVEQSHCLTLGSGLELQYWFFEHFGLNARLLLNAVIPVYQAYDDSWSSYVRGISPGDEMGFAMELGFAVGLSF